MADITDFAPGDRAILRIDSWAGRRRIPVRIFGRTPKRLRVELLADTWLPNRRHYLAGSVVLVPVGALARES